MKQFIHGSFEDHTSCFGYQKKIAYVHLVGDGEEMSQGNCVGYMKTEPILNDAGEQTGEVFYYRGNAFPRKQPRYFTTPRALLAFMQAHYVEGETEKVAESGGFGDDLDSLLSDEETVH